MSVDSDTTTLAFEGDLVLIGGGRMGAAIAGGLLGSSALSAERIVIVEPDERRARVVAEEMGVRVVTCADEVLDGAGLVMLAVKPQVMESVVSSISSALAGRLVVSIAAGISCARIESWLPADTPVVRVMPNTPALVGEGMALVSGGSEATAEQVALVNTLFSRLGGSLVIDERMQDAGTAISGCGPAYFALVVDALARAGVAQGLSRSVAQQLAVQTMLGTARMLAETGMHPEELVDAVASPGGATIAAVGKLEKGGVRHAFLNAVGAAVKRSRELGA